jgi:cytoskeletal protein RodZ
MSDLDTPTERRRDVNTRKVIEVLSEKFDEKLEEKLKGVVMWERLSVILGVSAVVIVSAAWVVTTMASSRAEASATSAKADVATLRKDSGDAIQLVREELKETRTDIRGLYRSVRTNQPQPRLAAPVPELPPNPITAKPKE